MDHLLVAAIDFGTTYSGWAFSFRHEFESDPIKISAKNWTGGQLVSQKGPTCLLIKPDGETFDSFGYEAESKYGELALEHCHKQWYYFSRFKMMLFNRIGIERNILIEDATGKKLPAKTVFMLSIKYLKDDLIESSGKRLADSNIRNSDIHWVLTVPAIWNDAAKQFMREAAEQAGISGDHLTICLEPEAASLYCRHLPVEKKSGQNKNVVGNIQTRYTVSGLGRRRMHFKHLPVDELITNTSGGTVDITVHEIQRNGDIRELHKASGGDWGGTKVDLAFENFLGEIVGKDVITQFKDKHMEDYIELFRDFEIKKRDPSSRKNAKITLRIPLTLFELVNEMTGVTMKERIRKTKYREKLEVLGDKIRFESDVMQSLFNGTISKILRHVEMLLKEPSVSGCAAIVMVGGFSESQLLQEGIQEKFGGLSIIIPDEAGLAVLKGAVIYGHNPTTIAERICKFTYGRSTCHITTLHCNHPNTRRKVDDNGNMRCHDLFRIHAEAGQAVKLGEEGEEFQVHPISDDQTRVTFEIFASSTARPVLVTEQGCTQIGRVTVPIKDTSFGRKRKFLVCFIFGGTEIQVKITDKITRKIIQQSVDFLG